MQQHVEIVRNSPLNYTKHLTLAWLTWSGRHRTCPLTGLICAASVSVSSPVEVWGRRVKRCSLSGKSLSVWGRQWTPNGQRRCPWSPWAPRVSKTLPGGQLGQPTTAWCVTEAVRTRLIQAACHPNAPSRVSLSGQEHWPFDLAHPRLIFYLCKDTSFTID